MDRDELDQHLSRISTMWTMVLEAHGGEADAATAALAGLAQRYSGVVYRYLLGAVRDPDAAAELSQEFALRILRGAFRRADPSRGRFRDYLKTALIHLVDDYHTAQRARPRPLPLDVPASPSAGGPGIRSRTSSRAGGRSCWTGPGRRWRPPSRCTTRCCLFRVENPDVPSPRMAEQLGARLGTSDAARPGPQGLAALARQVRRIAGRRGRDLAGRPFPRGAGRGAARAGSPEVLPLGPGAACLNGRRWRATVSLLPRLRMHARTRARSCRKPSRDRSGSRSLSVFKSLMPSGLRK